MPVFFRDLKVCISSMKVDLRAMDLRTQVGQVNLSADSALVSYMETNDIRDRSNLNVIAVAGGKPYLIDVVTREACNHSTLSQAVTKQLPASSCNHATLSQAVIQAVAYIKLQPCDTQPGCDPGSHLHQACNQATLSQAVIQAVAYIKLATMQHSARL